MVLTTVSRKVGSHKKHKLSNNDSFFVTILLSVEFWCT